LGGKSSTAPVKSRQSSSDKIHNKRKKVNRGAGREGNGHPGKEVPTLFRRKRVVLQLEEKELFLGKGGGKGWDR